VYDPFDRTASQDVAGKSTVFTYLGMDKLLLKEEIENEDDKSYQYAPWNQKLTQITHKDGGTREYSQYTYRPRGDVEAITKENGNTRATYGYTAYGKDDTSQFTGEDKPDAANPDAEPYNAYRFNASRWDVGSGTYDMGFRNYDPGLNRFLTRDMYGGALADMNLATDPFTGNRYSFTGGNPVSFVELDGHLFGMSWSDLGHAALDVVGLVPVVGEVADVANGVWYAAEGNYVDAALSMASAIPLAGYGATAVKAVRYGDRVIDAVDTANDVRRAADRVNDARRLADDVPTPGRTVDGPPVATRADTPSTPTRADTPAGPPRVDTPAAPPRVDTPAMPARATTGGAPGPTVVYRGGSRTVDNFTPRPGLDTTGLSTFDNLGAFKPGTKVQVIDVSKLRSLRAVPDAEPPGHVSIAPRDITELPGWAGTRGTGQAHPLTEELLGAVVREIRIPK
jgi:RHS repeat-associated protein